MSFTAEVKDELSRVSSSCDMCEYAQLAALVRVCGTLSYRGPSRYSLRITTETGAVASSIIKLTRRLFELENRLIARRSVLHKKRNYLIEVPEQRGLEEALIRLGILRTGSGLVSGIEPSLVSKRCCKQAFIRGAFMAGGFIADPRGDFHLEIAVTGYDFAQDLIKLIQDEGVKARLNHRRGAYAIYIKSYEDIVSLLASMGAQRTTRAIRMVRDLKQQKNVVNRQTNAEFANSERASNAAADQRELIEELDRIIGIASLPSALREFCLLRQTYREMSLADLGSLAHPPVSKSAMYHRWLRLTQLAEEAKQKQGR